MNLYSLLAEISANDRYRGTVAQWFDMDQHPYGWLSLLPPIVAIVLAILTRRILISLFLAILSGALILTYYEGLTTAAPAEPLLGGYIPGEAVDAFKTLLNAMSDAWSDHLWPTLTHPDKISVFVFTCLMGAIVGMVNRAAGMRGLLHLLSPFTGSVRKAQVVAWFSGLLVFFDDYANTMLLGTTFRSLFDRLKISREKLAYIVDSTAAPVAGLAIVSTWIAGEIGYINDGVKIGFPAGQDINAFDLFLQSIPYRFYVLWALFFVVVLAVTRRDFGPMLKAEVRARKSRSSNSNLDDHPEFLVPEQLDWQRMQLSKDHINSETLEAIAVANDATLAPTATKARSLNAILPIAVTVVAILGFMYQSGYEKVRQSATSEEAVAETVSAADANANQANANQAGSAADLDGVAAGNSTSSTPGHWWEVMTWLRDVFGESNSYTSLVYGSIVGFFFTLIWLSFQKIVPTAALSHAAGAGAAQMVPALMVLWLASTLSSMTGNNPTNDYEAEVEQARTMAKAIVGAELTPNFANMDRLKRVHETLHLHQFNRDVIIDVMAPAFSDAERFSHEISGRVTSLSPDTSFYNRYLYKDGQQVDWDEIVKSSEKPVFNPKDGVRPTPPSERSSMPTPAFDAPPVPENATAPSPPGPRAAGGPPNAGGGPRGAGAGPGAGGPGAGGVPNAGAPGPGPQGGGLPGGLGGGPPAGGTQAGGPPGGGARPGGGMGQSRPVDPDFSEVWEFEDGLSFPFADFRHRLHTGQYLSSLLTRQAGPVANTADHPLVPWLPTIIFVLAGVTAFATGSSWGTMGIVMPLAIPLATSLLSGQGTISPDSPILLATIGSVLAGAVFGDHCSPISDTTVLSSQASGCDHLAHVWTQMPYSLAVGLVTIFFGTIPVGFGIPWQVCLPVGTVALIVIVVFRGRTVDSVLASESATEDLA